MGPEDAVMGDPDESPPAHPIIPGFKTFPKGGAERKLLEDWLRGSSNAAKVWVDNVEASKFILQRNLNKEVPLTAEVMGNIKRILGIQDDIRKTFTSRGIEPEVLNALFGDPIEYDVKPCSDDSLTDLLLQNDIDILIGMCHLCMHSTLLDASNSFNITAAAKIDQVGYDSISPSRSLDQ
jgi:hypothetical protein